MARGTWKGSGTWQTTGGGGGALVLIAVAVLIGSGAVSVVARALEVIAIVLGCTVAVAVAGCIGWVVWQLRQDRQGGAIARPPVYQLPPKSVSALTDSRAPAIEPPREVHLHFHGTDPADVAALIHRIERNSP